MDRTGEESSQLCWSTIWYDKDKVKGAAAELELAARNSEVQPHRPNRKSDVYGTRSIQAIAIQ